MATTTVEALPAALRAREPVGERPVASRDRKKKRARLVFLGLVGLALLGALVAWLVTRGVERTDDAQLEGHIVNVAARVQGQIRRVLVQDNQQVRAGDVLVELDPAQLDARRQAAEADLASARSQLDAAQAQLQLIEQTAPAGERTARGGVAEAQSGVQASRAQLIQAQAGVRAAQDRFDQASRDLDRARTLRAQDVLAQAEVERFQLQFDQAASTLEQARAGLANVRAQIAASSGGLTQAQGRLAQAQSVPQQLAAARAAVETAEAKVQQSESAVRLAQLDLEYTRVVAPIDGIVSRRTAEPGQMVGPDRPLLALVGLRNVWIVANFKEDQLHHMRPGQKATVKVDALGGRSFDAHVESLAGATGARFALLPPDNATGNYIKVVQRVPVLLRFDGERDPLLRPGLSVDVKVDVSSKGQPLPQHPPPRQEQQREETPQARRPR